VTVKGNSKKKVKAAEKKSSSLFRVITAEQIKRAGHSTIGNVILGMSGLRIMNGYLVAGGFTDMKNVGATAEPLLVINGVEIQAASMASNAGLNGPGTASPVLNYVNSINIRNVESIQVITGPEAATYGVRGAWRYCYQHGQPHF
jgi:outer membrane receptor protein involved in Fe transport